MHWPFVQGLPESWSLPIGILLAVVDLVASVHVLTCKRDVRAAIGWIGLIWLVPGIGSFLYVLLGLNRIRRRASALQRRHHRDAAPTPAASAPEQPDPCEGVEPSLLPLARLAERVSGRRLQAGNRIELLQSGDEAYPAMLAAIDSARRSVALSTYIFGADRAGQPFIEALGRAAARGVEVRVLIDGIGVRYTWPPVHRALRRAGVETALFLPRMRDAGLAFFNLRSHRKALTVDGRIAFTGGINIQARNRLADRPARPVRDLHFRLEGPIAAEIQEVFAADWHFTTGEALDGAAWAPEGSPDGGAGPPARVLASGPDGDLEIVRTLMLGALAAARESVRIVTPYFLPDASTIAALGVTALRGVEVDVVLPERVNIPLVQWAAAAQLWQVVAPGCRVHFSPPPFDHSKLMLVDGAWCLFGSSNWDPRSLRLNFELDVECHDRALAARLDALVLERIANARHVTLAELDARALPIRVRDGAARLLSPYL